MILIKLGAEHLPRLAELDRSEEAVLRCHLESGGLSWSTVAEPEPGWGGPALQNLIAELHQVERENGVLMGAQARGRLIACAALGGIPADRNIGFRSLLHCYIDREWRKKGLGSALLRALGREAEREGASRLFIPSTRTAPGITFWMNRGAELLPEWPQNSSQTRRVPDSWAEDRIPFELDLANI